VYSDSWVNFQDEPEPPTEPPTEPPINPEAYTLFAAYKKLYLDSLINSVENKVTDKDLPGVLGDTTFSGNVEADIEHSLKIGSSSKVAYSQQPTSDDDPTFNIQLSTNPNNQIYNATVTFDKSIAFNNSNSKGEIIKLFGKNYIVGGGTNNNQLVLLGSGQRLQ
jgi:hypothetical protein